MIGYPSFGAKALFWGAVCIGFTLVLGGLLVWGFLSGQRQAEAEARREGTVRADVKVAEDGGYATITLNPQLQKLADIRTTQPKALPYEARVQAYGSVLDLQAFTDLSNTISNAKAQLAIAEARLAASMAAFERAKVLEKKGGIITAAQFEAADATYRADAASVQAGQVQAQNAAASAYQSWGPVLGQSLVENTALAKDLVQHKKVLVQVTLPLGMKLARAPEEAFIETAAGQQIRIAFVSPATRTDPKIQGVSYFYIADAASGALPGMNVIAFLPLGETVPGVAIPASAVVWLQGSAWVYLQTAGDSFTRRAIPTTEPQAGGGYVVPADPGGIEEAAASSRPKAKPGPGIPVDLPLVVEGAQVLLSQEFSAQIQVGGD